MKKLYLILMLAMAGICSKAATSITTTDVGGQHWTTAGSPYLIFNDIQVAPLSTLQIDPGVQVVFQGWYGIAVYGDLQAAGTAAQLITFTVQDTTGWHIITSGSTSGGWKGITFWDMGTAEASVVSYCKFLNVKNGGIGLRSFPISHCEFSRFITTTDGGGIIGGTPEIGHCTFSDNRLNGVSHICFDAGALNIHDNTIRDNYLTSNTIGCYNDLIFRNNVVYNNKSDTAGPASIVNASGMTTVIEGNRIYNNVTLEYGPIMCYNTNVEIKYNYICNNASKKGPTGTSEDEIKYCMSMQGGGIFLTSQYLAPAKKAVIHNNIIANNYAALVGGGIFIFHYNADIYNNLIMNNKSLFGGAVYVLNAVSDGSNTAVNIKNNIFYNNRSTQPYTAGLYETQGYENLWIGICDTLNYDHNWSERYMKEDALMLGGSSINVLGDSSHNIKGALPMLVTPTINADVTESALAANFRLQGTSPCINKGFNGAMQTGWTDHAGGTRILGGTVDIGPYESTVTAGIQNTTPMAMLHVYPNPASDVLHITLEQATGTLVVYDAAGRAKSEITVQDKLTTIDTQKWERGIYLIACKATDGTFKGMQKVVVE